MRIRNKLLKGPHLEWTYSQDIATDFKSRSVYTFEVTTECKHVPRYWLKRSLWKHAVVTISVYPVVFAFTCNNVKKDVRKLERAVVASFASSRKRTLICYRLSTHYQRFQKRFAEEISLSHAITVKHGRFEYLNRTKTSCVLLKQFSTRVLIKALLNLEKLFILIVVSYAAAVV